MGHDQEYGIWSAATRYLYDERIAILTDGRAPLNALIDQIARQQARSAHVQEASFTASGSLSLRYACGG